MNERTEYDAWDLTAEPLAEEENSRLRAEYKAGSSVGDLERRNNYSRVTVLLAIEDGSDPKVSR
jgi:hypothetical protein